ncbi:MAG: hypothetical protein V4858_24510 [Pseudomonadota bacterium]
MNIQSVHVGGAPIRGPLRVVALQPVELDHYLAPEVRGARSLLSGVTAGATAKLAWSGFQASNTLGADEIAKLLVQNGLSPQHAPTVAQKALDIIHSEPTKVLLVAVAAGGTAWAALEAGSKVLGLRFSTWRKLLLSVAVAIVIGLGYHYLRTQGYFL